MKIYDKKANYLNFNAGLTRTFVNQVKNTNPVQIEKELLNKGIFCQTHNIKSVAACFKKVVEIMEYNHFQLPKILLFEPLENGVLGSYSLNNDSIIINSNYEVFYDIEKQNKMEENQKSFHPITKNFLHTYIHEFIHAAHFKNLKSNHSENDLNNVLEYLIDTETNDNLLNPINKIMKKDFKETTDQYIEDFMSTMKKNIYITAPGIGSFIYDKAAPTIKNRLTSTVDLISTKILDYLIPNQIGNYAKTNLMEYTAEKVSLKIAYNLNKCSDEIKQTCTPLTLEQHPKNWILKNRVLEHISNSLNKKCNIDELLQHLEQELKAHYNYIDGDIWHGNIQSLKENSI